MRIEKKEAAIDRYFTAFENQTLDETTITGGTPTQHREAMEALIAEVRITDEGVIPVYRVPTTPPSGDSSNTPTTTNQTPVRTMVRLVGRTHHYANHDLVVEGDPLPVRLSRSRARTVDR